MERNPTADSSEVQQPFPRLSICISTVNRADFLRATLDKMLPQLTAECEVLVVDNASSDSTADVVAEQMRRSDRLRYVRKETNHGMDSNFDRAVGLARGEYCWLMSDDDLLKPGAVAAVLDALRGEPSMVLVNYEFRDFTMSRVLQDRALDFDSDRVYGAWEADRMFVEIGDCVRYIGAIVMRRAVWLARDRELYNGSVYAFVGIIFQERFPGAVHVIAQPCVSYRLGTRGIQASPLMDLVLVKWPSLVASLPLAEASKRRIRSAQPWKHFYELLTWRGSGLYTYEQYSRWIRPQLRSVREKAIPVVAAIFPRALANLIVTLHLSARGERLREMQGLHLEILRASPFYFRNWGPRGRGVTSLRSSEPVT
jgi:abequosyltransferase